MVHRGPIRQDMSSQYKHQIAAASQEAEVDITKLLLLHKYENQEGRGGLRKLDRTNWVLEYTSNYI